MRRVRTAWAAGAVLALTACGGAPTEPAGAPSVGSPTADLAESMSVSVVQYRRDVVPRRVQVKVENTGSRAVVVDAVELDSPAFEPLGPVVKEATLAPGARVDLRVDLGAVVCDSSSREPTVSLWADGADDPVAVTVGAEALAEVRARECAEEEVRAVVEVAFGGVWERVGEGEASAVAGTLTLRHKGSGPPASVASMGSSTLFKPFVETLPVTVSSTSPDADLPVRFVPQRCDGHAVGEAHKGYLFGVRVTLDGGDDVVLPLSADAGRDVLQPFLLDRCGLAVPTS